MIDERELIVHPIVQESVQHNARVSPFERQTPAPCIRGRAGHCSLCESSGSLPDTLTYISPQTVSNIRALTASLFGVAAGTLGLESFPGFIFYFIGTAIVSLLIYVLKTESKPEGYFYHPLGDLWAGDMFGGLMSFVLTWTLFYGLCKA